MLPSSPVFAAPSRPAPAAEPPPQKPLPAMIRKSLAGAGVTLLVLGVVISLEQFAPDRWKPSTMLGTFHGRTESSEMVAKLAAAQAMERALKEENARMANEIEGYKNSLEMQKAGYQAQLDTYIKDYETRLEMERAENEQKLTRASEAYKALYQRGNMLADGFSKMQTAFAELRLNTVREGQGAKVGISKMMDWIGVIGELGGDPRLARQARQAAESYRSDALRGIDDVGSARIPQIDREAWFRGLPDPAQITFELTQSRGDVPPDRTRPPAIPAAPGRPSMESYAPR